MTNFEKYTSSPEVLARLLRECEKADKSWDKAFLERCCAICELEDCPPDGCRFENFRNNPLWWLRLEAEEQGTTPQSPAVQAPLTRGAEKRAAEGDVENELFKTALDSLIDDIAAAVAKKIKEGELND